MARLVAHLVFIGLWAILLVAFVATTASPDRSWEAIGLQPQYDEQSPLSIAFGLFLFIMVSIYNSVGLGLSGAYGLQKETLFWQVVAVISAPLVFTGIVLSLFGLIVVPMFIYEIISEGKVYADTMLGMVLEGLPLVGLIFAGLYRYVTAPATHRNPQAVPRPLTMLFLMVVTVLGSITALFMAMTAYQNPPDPKFAEVFSDDWWAVSLPVVLAALLAWASLHIIRRLMHVGVSTYVIGAMFGYIGVLAVIWMTLGSFWVWVAFTVTAVMTAILYRIGKNLALDAVAMIRSSERRV